MFIQPFRAGRVKVTLGRALLCYFCMRSAPILKDPINEVNCIFSFAPVDSLYLLLGGEDIGWVKFYVDMEFSPEES